MKNSDLNKIMNNEISDLVDLLHEAFKALAKHYDLNIDQISEMEKDFIARLAFSTIKYGIQKAEEGDCESCPAKDRCSFKESEKPEGLPDYVVNALLFIKAFCRDHDCDNCPFASAAGLFCHLNDKPSDWEV